MNLSRFVRFRQEKVLFIGIIPVPKEPKHDIEAPLVEELWSGTKMRIHSKTSTLCVQCALLCVACDIAAARKVICFLGHLAALGCSMCLKWFPGRVGCIDYSGFDRTQWQPRNVQEHRIPLRKYSFPPV